MQQFTEAQELKWEDPLSIKALQKTEPVIWKPNQPPSPINFEFTRNQQQVLLPFIEQPRQAACEKLSRIKADTRYGGELALETIKRDITLEILYRRIDHPGFLTSYIQHIISDHAVLLPASHKPGLSVLNDLFPMQRVPEITDRRKSLIDASQELGLIERMGGVVGDLSPDRIVVYPATLKFITFWIMNIKSPISDVRPAENDSRIAAVKVKFGTHPNAIPDDPDVPQAAHVAPAPRLH